MTKEQNQSTSEPATDRQDSASGTTPSDKATRDLAEILPTEILESFEEAGIDTSSPEKILKAIAVTTSMSRSPWPSADMLAEYREFDRSLPDKLIAELKGQSEHRRRLEGERQSRSENRQDRSQRYAFIIAIVGILAAGGFSLAGAPTALAVTIVVAAIGGPNTATVLARLIDRWK
ncbi:MAG TPA: hypothetical protein VGN75_15800 [Kaistia sp.]|jgi:hypothetical protein|nr:hypothetical protein [Kaistia sp.]